MITKKGGMNSAVREHLQETWANPVFGDTFPPEQNAERLAWAEQYIGTIATLVTVELGTAIAAGMPEWPSALITRVVEGELVDKTNTFSAALTVGEIEDLQPLVALCVGVGLMYTVDQTMDRGDEPTVQAVEWFDSPATSPEQWGDRLAAKIQARSTMLRSIHDKVAELALPEDAPFVEACFIEQVLKNEAVIYRLSREYESLPDADQQAFLAHYGRLLAETTTINAGFPSISSSLYAIYRKRDPSLPPLSEVYASKDMTDFLQLSNVVVRLWDELGDWEMDSGRYPEKGIRTLNPFNDYHPSTIQRFCELAFITDADQVVAIQHAFADFHRNDEARQEHAAFILEVLGEHTRQYVAQLRTDKPEVWSRFEQYITLCKRVMEIGYVNHIGDMALANADIVAQP